MTRALGVTTILVSLMVLALDLWPGAIAFAILCPFLCCASLPILGVVGAVWAAMTGLTVRRQQANGVRLSPTVVMCVGWMLLCSVLVLFDIPRLVAFWYNRKEFEALAATTPVTETGVQVNRWVGCFHIDECGADGQGAVYFRTVSHPDGIGPDRMSYGLARLPNGRGNNPFGHSKYSQSHLFGDWYSFAVSDD